MRKKLTISLEKRVYDGLHRRIKKRGISQFIERLVRPYVVSERLDAAYRDIAADTLRESKALAWAEELVGDPSAPTRAKLGVPPRAGLVVEPAILWADVGSSRRLDS